MIWLLGSLTYASAALCCARLMAGHLAWTFHHNHKAEWPVSDRGKVRPNGEQWFGAWCVAAAVMLVWPLCIAPWLVGKRVHVGAEAAADLAEREARIRQAERELGIG